MDSSASLLIKVGRKWKSQQQRAKFEPNKQKGENIEPENQQRPIMEAADDPKPCTWIFKLYFKIIHEYFLPE